MAERNPQRPTVIREKLYVIAEDARMAQYHALGDGRRSDVFTDRDEAIKVAALREERGAAANIFEFRYVIEPLNQKEN